ncbi:MAG: hypothetical protein M3Y71_06700 [Actinomycetota bacterium]|nr:hypothetical protein [Actinomycetota bacterium]
MSTLPASFPFAFEDRYVAPARLFGVTPGTTSIVVDAGRLRARFGHWQIDTPLTNIASVSLTGPYAFLKTAGPAHLGITDLGLTFATNSRAGVCLELRERIRGIDPLGWLRHPNLTLTPADCAGLAAALR